MGLSLGQKFDEHGRIIWPPLPSQTAPLHRRKPRASKRGEDPTYATSQLLVRNSGASRRIVAPHCANL